MKKTLLTLFCAFLGLTASAQQDSFLSHMFLPVDAGVSFATTPGIEGAFYMRASLEYRFNIHKGPFILAELDTRTHPYKDRVITMGNAIAGDAAFTDILIGPGYRFAPSDKFKIALSVQGGASNLATKNVSEAPVAGQYILTGMEKWAPVGKLGVMLEYYLNPSFDLFVAGGLPVTTVPNNPASMDTIVLFPTVSIGFNMALE